MSRDNNPDVFKNLVPDPLLTPMVNAIGTAQQTGLNGWDLICDNFCLLFGKSNIRCEKPNKLVSCSVLVRDGGCLCLLALTCLF